MSIDLVNRRAFAAERMVSSLARVQLRRSEKTVLENCRGYLKGREVLDLGCGPGRMIPYLMSLGARYTGIDYSAAMVTACQRRHPAARILRCDFRDMNVLPSGFFGAAICAFNSMDNMDHDDRLQALRETRRVLASDGLFIFSTHNRNYAMAGCVPRVRLSLNPLTTGWSLLRFLRNTFYHRRNIKYCRYDTAYAILNDEAEGYRLLTYYIDPQQQVQQLRVLGFEVFDMYDASGNRVAHPGDDTSHSPWIYYVARKR